MSHKGRVAGEAKQVQMVAVEALDQLKQGKYPQAIQDLFQLMYDYQRRNREDLADIIRAEITRSGY